MAALLKVKGLEVKYHTRAGVLTAIREINFEVNEGQIVGIVGESGCGKSTVAAALLRLLPPNGQISRGQVLFKGQDLCHASAEGLRNLRGTDISMIFQDPMTSLNPVFNIETQMVDVLHAHNGGQSRDHLRKRAVAMLDRVGIPDAAERIKHYPHQFSGGMRQRIMIAMALMANPALLIADEPTSALDVTLEAQILELVRGLREELGTAILYISHDLGVIAQLCDQVIVMYAGNIVEQGDCFGIFEHPRHPYTQALLAAYPSHRHRLHRLAAIPGRVPSLKDLPVGCKFADRCKHARPICFNTEPQYFTSDDGRLVLCHLLEPESIEAGEAVSITAEVAAAPAPARPSAQNRNMTGDIVVATQDLYTFFEDKVSLLAQFFGQKVGYVRAVDGIEFNARRGETIGLVGESGSGKTTLGKTILRLIKPDRKSVV